LKKVCSKKGIYLFNLFFIKFYDDKGGNRWDSGIHEGERGPEKLEKQFVKLLKKAEEGSLQTSNLYNYRASNITKKNQNQKLLKLKVFI